jgi:S-DNA-T family DNA segregation ATPase FtsK/SpoIIIE
MMARKRNSNKHGRKEESIGAREWGIKGHITQAILSILFIVLALFFTLAAFSLAGVAGHSAAQFLTTLFGAGYFLVPLSMAFLAAAFWRALEIRFAVSRVVSVILFFVSSIGIIHIVTGGAGGIIGAFIAEPLLSFFDLYVSYIFLVALMLISLIVFFDIRISDIAFKLPAFRSTVKDDAKEETEDASVLVHPAAALEAERALAQPEQREEARETDKANEQKDGVGIFGFMSQAGRGGHGKRALDALRLGTPFTPPPLSLLEKDSGKPSVGDIKANANLIKRTLKNFGIEVEMDDISVGPAVTRYALKPAEGVKLSRIEGLQKEIQAALSARSVRVEAPIPGKSLVGIEVSNVSKSLVGLASLLSSPQFMQSDKPLLVTLGKNLAGQPEFADLAKMPHLLVAGATGSGKSVTIHMLIASLLYRNPPESLKFILVDPKRVELTLYNDIPHLLTPVIKNAKKAILALKWAAKEMERRYDILEQSKTQNIDSYHKNVLAPAIKKLKDKERGGGETENDLPETMPYIIIVIDELADIMSAYPKELEAAIVRLAQMSRAVGIHLILSTQRPDVRIITGLIKANIPSRIALQVSSQIDSRTILDKAGAEKLLGKGDMLFQSGEMGKPVRIQSGFITEEEVKRLSTWLIEHYSEKLQDTIEFNEQRENETESVFDSLDYEGGEDDKYDEAKEVVLQAGKASTSFLQRKLGIGYSRAAKLMDMLEERGVIGPQSGSKPREVIGAARSGNESDAEDVYEPNDNQSKLNNERF